MAVLLETRHVKAALSAMAIRTDRRDARGIAQLLRMGSCRHWSWTRMLALARGDGRYGRLLKAIGRVQLLILDDWGLAPLTGEQRCDLLEFME